MLQRRLESKSVMHMQVGTTAGIVFFVGSNKGRDIWKRPEQMWRLEEQRPRRWASLWWEENSTGDSCSVVGAWLTSFSQSVTPFPLGLWGCTLLPASLCPELLWGVPLLSHDVHLPHSRERKYSIQLIQEIKIKVHLPY